MSAPHEDELLTEEERILRAMKKVLTDVAKDTYAKPGHRHPLSQETIEGIRRCLKMIAQREHAIAKAHGRESKARPRFVDERPQEVVIPIDPAAFGRKNT
ncbi:MAG: segregation and condensation protein A [Gammaproteobacteria bacterium]|nr:MAG: segregation and condensation protein A [Gammaproteobacteria bacterium]